MARTAGRSNWIAWPAGLLCLAVVAALAWLSGPMIPGAVQWIGDALRGPTSSPVAGGAGPVSTPAPPDVAACRALYTSALWSELTARTGGGPVQDASPPALSAASVVAALAPAVRVSCSWTAVSTGTIATTLADVAESAAPVAQAALQSQGFTCAAHDGLRCTRVDGAVSEDVIVRDGVWLSSRLEAWHPTLYTERIAEQVWP